MAGRPGAMNAGARPGGPGMERRPGGGATMRTADGREFNRGPNGRVESFRGAHGEEAHFGRDGRVHEIRSGNMRIEHGPGGMRRVEMERADHSRLVVDGRGRGYIARPYQFRGRAFDRREYYVNGVRYSRFYHPYYYHGVYLHAYVPGVYYAPAFYGWAYAPWAAPAPYAWGWYGAPWYSAYGVYFAPYPMYAGPPYWLTDYMISQQLQAAYQAGYAAAATQASAGYAGAHLVYASYAPGGNSAVALTPAIKQAIANEVQLDLQVEQAAAQAGGDMGENGGVARLLGDGKPHTLIASSPLTVEAPTGDCSLTQGDVVQTMGAPAGDAATLQVVVLASKSGDCGANASVPVKIEDLQEMQNEMLSGMDQGLAELKAHPGAGGLPTPPAAALAGQTEAPYAAAAPPPDANVGQEIQQADQQAQQTEQQVMAEATPPPDAGGAEGAAAPAAAAAPPSAPTTIALGQTTTDVALNKGRPKQIVNLGPKAIWVYPDMKIIFVNGKVSDVQ